MPTALYHGTESLPVVWAPGRVNLIGEHTDYSGGFVLPAAIQYGTSVEVSGSASRSRSPRKGTKRSPRSRPTAAARPQTAGCVTPRPSPSSSTRSAGPRPGSSPPCAPTFRPAQGSRRRQHSRSRSHSRSAPSLTSSSSHSRSRRRVSGRSCVRSASRAASSTRPRRSWGARDRRCCSTAGRLRTGLSSVPPETELVVIDSGISHSLETSGYADRRREVDYGMNRLGAESSTDLLLEDAFRLDALHSRRMKHVVSENTRVQEFVAAVELGDLEARGGSSSRAMRACATTSRSRSQSSTRWSSSR